MGEEDEREEEKLLQLKCCFLLQSPAVLAPTVRRLGELGIGKPPRRSPSLAGSQKTPASEWRYQCSRIGPGLRSYIHMRLQRLCSSLARSLPFSPFCFGRRPLDAAGCCRRPTTASHLPTPPAASLPMHLPLPSSAAGSSKKAWNSRVLWPNHPALSFSPLSLLCGPPKRA